MTVAPTYVSGGFTKTWFIAIESRSQNRPICEKTRTCWPRVTSQVNGVYVTLECSMLSVKIPAFWMIRSTRSQSFEQYSATVALSSGFPVL